VKDIPIRTLPCRVQTMTHPAPDVMVLRLKLPVNERLQFLAGQYVEFLLKDGKRRAFSLANAPHDDELLELHVRLAPGGQFTEHVFHGMKDATSCASKAPRQLLSARGKRQPIVFVAGAPASHRSRALSSTRCTPA